jgi:pimeloyl-ACP methyl ester carboxylesterase
MPYEEVNGVRLHYEDEGHGSPVLLLHNAFGTGRSVFNGMIEYLAARGHRVLAPDARGYGGSRPPGRDFPADYYQRDMEDMAALLAALDLGPVHVVGLSDGAIIGLLLAITHPAQVRSLVTWAANADFPPEERGLYENLSQAGNSLDFLELMAERHNMGAAEARAMLNDFMERSLAITDGSGDVGLRGRLGQIQAPVLIGFGERGDFLPQRHADILHAEILNSELWLVPRVGHFWPVSPEGRELFASRVLDWITRAE